LTAAALLLAIEVSGVSAQQPGGQASTPPPGQAGAQTTGARGHGRLDIGLRTTSVEGDPARFERFRDLGDGGVFETFRWGRATDRWLFSAAGDHVGRDDQRFAGELVLPGRLKVGALWDQIPLVSSRDTRTLYDADAPGVLRIADDIQSGIQGGVFTIRGVTDRAVPFETKSRRDTGAFALTATPSRDVDVRATVTTASREGTMPWGASFGFNNAIEVPHPIDTRTTDVGMSVEWANSRGMVSAGYDGSWFDNHVQTLVWDNPFKLTDATYATAYTDGLGTSQGRMALFPSNTLHTVSASAAYRLPAKSRVFGNLAVGVARQDEPLVPHTINTAIAPIPLARTTAAAEVRTLAGALQFTSRPARHVSLHARYRLHDRDNQTPEFPSAGSVRLDQVADPPGHGPAFHDIRRQLFDADVSFTPIPFTALKIGYGRAQTDRTFRHFEVTTENSIRASVDTSGNPYVSFRIAVERGVRNGDHFELEVLEDVGEQPGMRHYDIADRDRARVTALATVTPTPQLGFTASVAAGHDDYEESEFGLRDNDHRVYTLGADFVPTGPIGLFVAYGFENYEALQNSRNASPGAQFTDPLRNWAIDSDDAVHTFDAGLDLRPAPRTEIRTAYGYSRAKSMYVYELAADSTLPRPQQLPPVQNLLRSATVDTRFSLTRQLALGFLYLYEHYTVDDYALGGGTISDIALPVVEPGLPILPTNAILLEYLYRPYTAHSGWVRLMYSW
jgi:MtrB/PioB family decaheme-associated outer membrane protein